MSSEGDESRVQESRPNATSAAPCGNIVKLRGVLSPGKKRRVGSARPLSWIAVELGPGIEGSALQTRVLSPQCEKDLQHHVPGPN